MPHDLGLYFSALPLDLDDSLVVEDYSLDLIGIVQIDVRFVRSDGGIGSSQYSYRKGDAGVVNRFRFPVGITHLISVSVFPLSGDSFPGRHFLRIYISRDQSSFLSVSYPLISGYISNNSPLFWPGSSLDSFESGEGFHLAFTQAAPPVGTSPTITVPSHVLWRIKSIQFRLITSAVVATRRPVVRFLRGTTLISGNNAFSTSAASLTTRFNFSPYVSGMGSSGSFVTSSIPELSLVGGDSFQLFVTNLDAGDQVDEIAIYVDQFVYPTIVLS